MTYTVRNLTQRLLCLHGGSGASYYIHARKSLELDDAEIRDNTTVEKLINRNVIQVVHHAAKHKKASVTTKEDTTHGSKGKKKAATS